MLLHSLVYMVYTIALSCSNVHSRLLKAVGLGQCANDGKTMTHYLNLPEVGCMIQPSVACNAEMAANGGAHGNFDCV